MSDDYYNEEDFEVPEHYEVEKKIKYVNVDKYKDLVNKIKDKIISLQDEIISGIGGGRTVQELDIKRYQAMVDVLKAMIQ